MKIILAIVLLFAVVANCEETKKACAKGKTGPSCDKNDVCVTKNPCVDNKKCSLNDKFEPVCACAPGFIGTKCTQRDCSITEFKGKNLNGKVFIDKDAQTSFEALDKLAKSCKLVVDITQSFTRSKTPDDKVKANETALYNGHGVVFKLKSDGSKKTVEEKKAEKKCFDNGLKATGLVQEGSNMLTYQKSDAKDVLHKQHGCLFKSQFPKVNAQVLKLVGKWTMISSKNWDEFLKENLVGWWTRTALKLVVPDIEFKNDGKKWTQKITSTFKNINTEFTEGVPFKSKSPISGTDTNHLCVEKDGKLYEEQTILAKKHRHVTLIREVNDKDQMIQTLKINGVVCVRTYKRV